MKILLQIVLIFGLYWLSEGLELLLPFPLPASVISLLLLLILLLVRVIREEQVKDVANFFLGDLGLLFVPAAVGIMQYVDVIRANMLPFLTICIVSTVLTFGVTSAVTVLTQRLLARHAQVRTSQFVKLEKRGEKA